MPTKKTKCVKCGTTESIRWVFVAESTLCDKCGSSFRAPKRLSRRDDIEVRTTTIDESIEKFQH